MQQQQHRIVKFGRIDFEVDEHTQLQALLRNPTPVELCSIKDSGAAGKHAYIQGWRLISLANETFGFNGWSHSIINQSIDFSEVIDGKFETAVHCTVKVELKDGTYHEDVGYGQGIHKTCKGLSMKKARKEAATDGLKRALKRFGNLLGNSLSYQPYSNLVLQSIGAPKPRQEKPDKAKITESISVMSAIPENVVRSRYNAMNNRLVRENKKMLGLNANLKEKGCNFASTSNCSNEDNKENIPPFVM